MPTTSRITIEPIAAFADNYIWWISDGATAIVVDPGDAAPVAAQLSRTGQKLDAILVTHHHGDHVGGVQTLRDAHGARVYGPANETIPGLTHPLAGGERLTLLDTTFDVLSVPGHTRGHLAYHAADQSALFCGDTLFACGCGRVFEETPARMFESLTRLAALPDDTRIYCAHEYTLANIRFAQAVEPQNADLAARTRQCALLRAAGVPTVPSTLAEERATNPFLRCHVPAVRARAAVEDVDAAVSATTTFAVLRAWKDRF